MVISKSNLINPKVGFCSREFLCHGRVGSFGQKSLINSG